MASSLRDQEEKAGAALPPGADLPVLSHETTSQRPPGSDPFPYQGRGVFLPSSAQYWKTSIAGLTRLGLAGRLIPRNTSISYLPVALRFPGHADQQRCARARGALMPKTRDM